MGNKDTGSKGEEMAAAYLVQQGFSILERNWRFRHWEVDIIASKNDRLHFFEVKTRTSGKYGKPEESMSFDKMKSLRNAAEEYQYRNPKWKYVQFDVVAISIYNGEPVEYFYIEDVYF
ncbi:MAG: YraN family protein [Chitinophagaceae bacterium]|jgi:putative endonuclease|nr:YraN family protein [Chitinophagaceae bacterium]